MGVKRLTPAMRQYMEIKEQYPDCILFFRMGDFYEMFFDDAIEASRILDIALTSRNKNKGDAIPLCGVPYHAGSSYIARLIEKGLKVAVCEQVEDPREAKGIVKREVVRVVTPGLLIDPDSLSARENNFLVAISLRDERFGLAVIDVSTGDFRVTESLESDIFENELRGLSAREIIVSEAMKGDAFLGRLLRGMGRVLVTYLPCGYFDYESAFERIERTFRGDGIRSLNLGECRAMAESAGAVLHYVEETQKDRLLHVNRIEAYSIANYLVLDEAARRNLELFSTIQENRREGSLIHVLDRTVTGMGARRLKQWLSYPLVNPENIKERHAAVSELAENSALRRDLRGLLDGVYDLERLAARVSMGTANGRDLLALKGSLLAVPGIKEAIQSPDSSLLQRTVDAMDPLPGMVSLIECSIAEDPPITVREGHMIKKGYDAELDELISMSTDGKRWIASLEARERSATGISNLRVGFNSVFGYYIEVTKANSHRVPDGYVRKQTLVNAERYINEELKGYEATVLNAEERRKKREYELFQEIRTKVAEEIRAIQETAARIADLDVLLSLAEAAEENGYTRPVVDDGDVIEIHDGRHPVIERMDLADGFVPNDLFMDRGSSRFLIITGPNMAGKSTYIRQTALIVLMAQMGSFVPASRAAVGIADKIFTRVGASDSLARGQSTFMVEMTEVASILKKATFRSLILLDEVGRGTSTFDGLSIAWAVAEFIHDSKRLGARTLFATHYHELTDMVRTREGVKNFSIAVKEWGDSIIFLRKIVAGGTNRSYGIQVARLAGVPEDVVARAREILNNLEKGELDEIGMPKLARGRSNALVEPQTVLPLFADEEARVIDELISLDLTRLTPIDALNKLDEWKNKIKDK